MGRYIAQAEEDLRGSKTESARTMGSDRPLSAGDHGPQSGRDELGLGGESKSPPFPTREEGRVSS